METRAEGLRFGTEGGVVAVRTASTRRYLGKTLAPGGEQRIDFRFPLSLGSVLIADVRHEFHGRIDGTRLVRVDVLVRARRP